MAADSISNRLVEDLCGIVRARQAQLAMRVSSYGEASWERGDDNQLLGNPITHEQIRELLELVIEAFEGIAGEIQGSIEIDAAMFTRGLDALRDAEKEEGR